MSKFAKALEQARRDQALQAQSPSLGDVKIQSAATRTQGASPAASGPASWAPGTDEAIAAGTTVDDHLVSLVVPAAFEAEQYRALRHAVEQMRKTANLQVVAVSSPAIGDGKTTTAINLAGALAQAPDARTLLIEADLRQPAIAHQLGVGQMPHAGLVDAIVDSNLRLADIVEARPTFNLSFIRAGQTPPSPYELLKSPRLGELVDEARRQFDYVIVDTPPLVSVQDCRVIARWVDGFLLVVAAHRTPRALVQEALNVIDPGKVIGLILNGGDHRPAGYDAGYHRPYARTQPPSANGGSATALAGALRMAGISFGRRDHAPARRARSRP